MCSSDLVRASTSSILDQVVHEYLKFNGLSPYTAVERECVGLSALRCALGLHINADNSNEPSKIEEHCIRCGLLTWNIERTKKGDFICVGGRPRLEVQPALVIVCLVMCGLLQSTQHIEGWSGVELIAALWAACSIPYRAEVNEWEGKARLVATADSRTPQYHISAHTFGRKLADNKLLFADIPLDKVGTTAVINADKGHGMDVVAPWLLIQAKHNVSLTSPYAVNVMDELGKAGLFSGGPLTPLTEALMLAWGNVPISTPPAVLEPLSHLLEHMPKERWNTAIVVEGAVLKEHAMNAAPVTQSRAKKTCVVTQLAVDPVPKGSLRVVLLLFGHSFLLRTSGTGTERSRQLTVTGSSGCVRLLTVGADKKAVANAAAVPADDAKAQRALATLADAVSKERPAFNFVLDVVYQPLKCEPSCV